MEITFRSSYGSASNKERFSIFESYHCLFKHYLIIFELTKLYRTLIIFQKTEDLFINRFFIEKILFKKICAKLHLRKENSVNKINIKHAINSKILRTCT